MSWDRINILFNNSGVWANLRAPQLILGTNPTAHLRGSQLKSYPCTHFFRNSTYPCLYEYIVFLPPSIVDAKCPIFTSYVAEDHVSLSQCTSRRRTMCWKHRIMRLFHWEYNTDKGTWIFQIIISCPAFLYTVTLNLQFLKITLKPQYSFSKEQTIKTSLRYQLQWLVIDLYKNIFYAYS